MQPPQLARAKRRNRFARGYVPKPVAETLPCFNICELVHIIPHKYGITRTQSSNSPSHPPIIGLRLTCEIIEVIHKGGNTQKFKLKWIRTNFGRPRPAIHCDKCQCPVLKLYNRYDDLACRVCRGTVYLSQKVAPSARPTLKAHRLEQFLALKSNINQRTRERLIKRFGEKALRPQSNYSTRGSRHWT
jgi:hypothetical protein